MSGPLLPREAIRPCGGCGRAVTVIAGDLDGEVWRCAECVPVSRHLELAEETELAGDIVLLGVIQTTLETSIGAGSTSATGTVDAYLQRGDVVLCLNAGSVEAVRAYVAPHEARRLARLLLEALDDPSAR